MSLALWRFIAAAAVLSVAAPGIARADGCRLEELTSLDMIGNSPGITVIAGHIGDKTENFVVSTGSVWSMVSDTVAAGLPGDVLPPDLQFINPTGRRFSAVRVSAATFGAIKLTDTPFLTGEHAALGVNILRHFDVEIDPVGRKVNLFKYKACDQAPAYWPHQDLAVVPFSVDPWGMISIPVKIDGVAVQAAISTSVLESYMDARVARDRLGVSAEATGTPPLATPDSSPIARARHQFGKIEFGELTIINPWVELFTPRETAPQRFGPPTLSLGANVLAGLHLYIAYREHVIYATSVQGDIAAGRVGPTGTAPANPMDAMNNYEILGSAGDEYRAGETANSLAKMDQAVAMHPQDPVTLLQRAEVKLKAHDNAGAQADIDAATALVPENAAGFIARGAGFARVGKPDLALHDLDKSVQLAPKSAAPLTARGAFYRKTKQYDLALQDETAALALAPKSGQLLNERCWTEAISNHLDEALADCNAALALVPSQPQILDSRAFVHLKAGRPAEASADYDASLAKNPQHASSLYGRSLAKRQRGDVRGADTDLAAARAFDPEIEQHFGT